MRNLIVAAMLACGLAACASERTYLGGDVNAVVFDEEARVVGAAVAAQTGDGDAGLKAAGQASSGEPAVTR